MLEPRPGQVIRYAYLWRSEAMAGREEAGKDRPCVVVLATKRDRDRTIVLVTPITHSPPKDSRAAVEIPAATKARLRLDQQRSWVITSELNAFTWPGPDIRPVDAGRTKHGFLYGELPEALTRAIITNVRDQVRDGKAKAVHRDETPPSSEVPTRGRPR